MQGVAPRTTVVAMKVGSVISHERFMLPRLLSYGFRRIVFRHYFQVPGPA